MDRSRARLSCVVGVTALLCVELACHPSSGHFDPAVPAARVLSPSSTQLHPDSVWIIRPSITGRIQEYREIRFQPGDRVVVHAGGCVAHKVARGLADGPSVLQAGRAVWEPYVGRLGYAHRTRYATIWIPGVTVGSEPLQSVLDDTLVIGPAYRGDPEEPYLRLGYEDDSYRAISYFGWNTRLSTNVGATACDPLDATAANPNERYAAWVTVHIARARSTPDSAPYDEADLIRALRLDVRGGSNRLLPPDSSSSFRFPWRMPGRVAINAFDLIVNRLDVNLIPRNPQWSWAMWLSGVRGDRRPDPSRCAGFPYALSEGFISLGVRTDALPNGCTSQGRRLSIDESIGHRNLWCNSTGNPAEFHGHVNWVPATYYGRVHFADFSPDHDADLDLYTPDSAGQTVNNTDDGGRLHLEFDRKETTDHFRRPRGVHWWWDRFKGPRADPEVRSALNSPDPDAKHQHFGAPDNTGTEAIVTGLLGLDAVHGAHAELHPVYVMALHLRAIEGSDTWAIMARNSGDEGDCSGSTHYLDLPKNIVRVALPLRENNPAPVAPDSLLFFRTSRAANWRVERDASVRVDTIAVPADSIGRYAVVSFTLDSPETGSVVAGYIRLRHADQPPQSRTTGSSYGLAAEAVASR